MSTKRTISVIGLGKLGGPIACAIASRGFKVIGVDMQKKYVDSINQHQAYLTEPDFAEILNQFSLNFSATQKYKDAIFNSDITFIIVPTPSLPDGTFSNKYLISALSEIGLMLKKKKSYHLVVIVSTVSPLSIKSQLINVLEKYSGKICGKGFGLCYNPAFVNLGKVISGFLHPDFILIGEFDHKSGDILSGFYKQLMPALPVIRRMNFINAEITKLALNTFITTKISYANMLTQLCQKIPGADVDIITKALGSDSRIGNKYLKGGTSYGGPCFPRDNRALLSLGKKIRVDLLLAKSTDDINQQHIKFIINIVRKNIKPGNQISILGLSYRTDTDVIDESAGIKIAQYLLDKGYKVKIYDPLSNPNAKKIFGSSVSYASGLSESLVNTSGIILTVPWQEFAKITPNMLRNIYPIFIIDCWRLLKNINFPVNVKYLALGVNNKLNN